ncbi:16415_t:CDS:2, partial [Dentiscutata heterogama]
HKVILLITNEMLNPKDGWTYVSKLETWIHENKEKISEIIEWQSN